ncbi:MAG: SpoIIE family protein phosphatase [Anaerolineae bacterium]|nr:SpoIIE family protein phosphatase [Anaerolineae bacterium]
MLTTVDAFLQRIAKRLIGEFDTLPESQRVVTLADIFVILTLAPFVVIALIWLIVVTDLNKLGSYAVVSLISVVLMLVFERLTFVLTLEVRRNVPASVSGTMGNLVGVALSLLVGESALWVVVIIALIAYVRDLLIIQRLPEQLPFGFHPYQRIGALRQLVNNTASVLPMLLSIVFYRASGGLFPLPDLRFETLLRGLLMVFSSALLIIPLFLPYFWYLRSSTYFTSASSMTILFLIASLLPFVVDPFGILLAGLYAIHGWPAYLFLLIGILLVALMAYNLSQQTQRSQQRSRELERLEQLGRALIQAPPDGSTLPVLLNEYIPGMFTSGKLEVWLYPDKLLVNHPEDVKAIGGEAMNWLRTQPETRVIDVDALLPWSGQKTILPMNLVPILEVDSQLPLGGVFYSQRFQVNPGKRLRELLPAMESLASQIASELHSAKLYTNTIANQRMLQEVALAGRIQATFLPNSVPVVPGWELMVGLEPARQTSGDFYDLFELPNHKLGMVVADVADKGMGAALYMALSRTLIRTFAVQYPDSPAQALTAANLRILSDTNAELFVTVFYAVLDPLTGTLTYCSAGHNPAFLLNRDDGGRMVQSLSRTGIPLGMFETVSWRETTVGLRPHDVLIIYTDGLTEAQTAEQDLYGEERLRKVAREHVDCSAEEIHAALLADVHQYMGDAAQFDDITLMVLVKE